MFFSPSSFHLPSASECDIKSGAAEMDRTRESASRLLVNGPIQEEKEEEEKTHKGRKEGRRKGSEPTETDRPREGGKKKEKKY